MLPSFSYFSRGLGVSTNELLLFYPLVDTNSLLAKICHRFPWFNFLSLFEYWRIENKRFSLFRFTSLENNLLMNFLEFDKEN